MSVPRSRQSPPVCLWAPLEADMAEPERPQGRTNGPAITRTVWMGCYLSAGYETERGKGIMQNWERGERDKRSSVNREGKLLESWPEAYSEWWTSTFFIFTICSFSFSLWFLKGCFSISPQQRNLEGYVGFANLPNQVYRKSVKRGFEFTLMVVGKWRTLHSSVIIFSVYYWTRAFVFGWMWVIWLQVYSMYSTNMNVWCPKVNFQWFPFPHTPFWRSLHYFLEIKVSYNSKD